MSHLETKMNTERKVPRKSLEYYQGKPFNGDPEKVNEFLLSYEEHAKAFEWDEEVKLNMIPLHLEGNAKLLYRQQIRTTGKSFKSWEEIERLLRENFEIRKTFDQALKELLNCRQQEGENPTLYAIRFKQLLPIEHWSPEKDGACINPYIERIWDKRLRPFIQSKKP